MASADEHFIYAESVNAIGGTTLMIAGFPVTKSVGALKAAIAEQVGDGCTPEDITVTYGSQELTDGTVSVFDHRVSC
jgi:hypothetical protein